MSALRSRSPFAATPHEIKTYFLPCTTTASSNTWTCYLNRLDQLFFSEPAHGFKTRLIVLLGCFSLIVALTATQLVLIEVERRRNKQPYWLWRWIRIEREPFLVTHQILITAYSALVAAVINIFYVVFEWRMVLDHDSQKTRIARRSTIYFPMVLGGLLCSFSLLQAFVVVLSRKGRTWSKWTLRSCVIAYFLCIILFTTGVVVIAVIGSKSWTNIWLLYQGLREDIMKLVPSWVPGTTPPITPALSSEFRQLRATVASSFRQQFVAKWLYTAVAFLNLVLASLCMALWAMMRRQLSRHSENMGRVTSDGEIFISSIQVETNQLDDAQEETATNMHTISHISFAHTSSPISEDGQDYMGKKEAVPDQQSSPRSAFQASAAQPWKGAWELRQAKDWVLMMGGVVMITSALLAAVLTWSSTWSISWVWAIVTLPFAATNAYHAWCKLSHTNATAALDESESNLATDAGTRGMLPWRPARAIRAQARFSGAEESLDAFLRSLEPQSNQLRAEMPPSLRGEVTRSEPESPYLSGRSK
ncbi:BZ3500_MvSof-1268-A1-R1_Chr11-1g03281 [Microbotryum saponariae]|uniref:BZ3500_MvSof-1268-A1-R1_Chr11-1g03281 protein n=1 Tax=Microbotryum saponariae TaxID=289078 RepID=A0A2X0M236_9BASI|nr:BZ3501_MvSof-1269-A2-R1_Chr11g02856 [Microbotryum saponariae]SDA03879.1 BZ3500_MvSof-1268-A1-R1_Chr11-1g03281 [Microbotryum saponariae]